MELFFIQDGCYDFNGLQDQGFLRLSNQRKGATIKALVDHSPVKNATDLGKVNSMSTVVATYLRLNGV